MRTGTGKTAISIARPLYVLPPIDSLSPRPDGYRGPQGSNFHKEDPSFGEFWQVQML